MSQSWSDQRVKKGTARVEGQKDEHPGTTEYIGEREERTIHPRRPKRIAVIVFDRTIDEPYRR